MIQFHNNKSRHMAVKINQIELVKNNIKKNI